MKSKVDIVFSKLVRATYADYNGFVKCVTCGKVMNWKAAQNGHCFKRGNSGVRFRLENCAPQCNECNCYRDGMTYEHKKHIIDLYGYDVYEELRKESLKVVKIESYEMRELLTLFRYELNRILKNKGL